MLVRPFRTFTDPQLGPHSGDLQIYLEIGEHVTRDVSTMEALRRPFRELAIVGAWGAFAGEHYHPSSSRLHLIDDGVQIAPGEMLWTFSSTALDPGALLLIQNLVHDLSVRVAPVQGLRIHQSNLHHDGALGNSLPMDFEPHPFEVDFSVENAQVAVLVEFVGRHDPDQLSQFREAWEAWEALAVQGAFADETYLPGKARLAVEEELLVTSAGLRAIYDDVAIADAGFYCLINMLHVLHERVAPIEAVIFE